MLSMDEYRVLTDIRQAVREIRDHLMTAPAADAVDRKAVETALSQIREGHARDWAVDTLTEALGRKRSTEPAAPERLTKLEEGLARAHKAAVEVNMRVARLNDIQGHRDPYLRRIEKDLDRLCLDLLELLPEDYPGAVPAEGVPLASLQMDPSP